MFKITDTYKVTQKLELRLNLFYVKSATFAKYFVISKKNGFFLLSINNIKVN